MNRSRVLVAAFIVAGLGLAGVAPAVAEDERDAGDRLGLACESLTSSLTDVVGATRENLGLPGKPLGKLAPAEESVDFPVTSDEMKTIDAVSSVRQIAPAPSARSAAGQILGADSFIGVAWRAASGWVVYHRPGAKSEGASRSIASRLGIDDSNVTTVEVLGGVSAVDAQANLEAFLKIQPDLDQLGAGGASLNERCGLLEIRVTPGSDRSAILRALELGGVTDGQYRLRDATKDDFTEIQSRGSSSANYIGGKRLQIGSSLGCTASMGFYKDTPGGRQWWGVSAAHCLPNQPTYSPGSLGTDVLQWSIGGEDIGVSPNGTTNYFVYGAGADVVVTQLDRSAVARTYETDFTNPDTFAYFVWWQWHGNLDAVGDYVCTAGATTNRKSCGILATRTDSYSLNSSQSGIGRYIYMSNMRVAENTSRATSGGDSGGTVWDRQSSTVNNVAGIHHGRRGSTKFVYGHISYVGSYFGLVSVAECATLGTC